MSSSKLHKLIALFKKYEIHEVSIFAIFILIISIITGIPKILISEPFGFHFIRQTDCLAFVKGYTFNQYSFFKPAILNITSINGNAASEFPIIYYITALFSNSLLPPYILLRIINFSLFILGIFSVFKLLQQVLKNLLWSLAIILLLISSTVLIFYSVNYLPDIPAFGLCIWACSIFFADIFIAPKSKNKILMTFILVTLSGLIKATFIFYPFCFICIVLINKEHVFNFKKFISNSYFIGGLVSITTILLWYTYAKNYNTQNLSSYFVINTSPIWNLEASQIKDTYNYIYEYWKGSYYYASSIHIFFLSAIFVLIFGRKINPKIWNLSILLLAVMLLYSFLFFERFKDHDYYFIALIPGIIFILISTIYLIEHTPFINNYIRITAYSVILIIGILGFNYSRNKLPLRLVNYESDIWQVSSRLSNFSSKLDSLDIDPKATIAVYGDPTMNGSLYFLNHRGITISNQSFIKQHYSLNELAAIDYYIVLDSAGLNATPLPVFAKYYDQLGNYPIYRNSLVK